MDFFEMPFDATSEVAEAIQKHIKKELDWKAFCRHVHRTYPLRLAAHITSVVFVTIVVYNRNVSGASTENCKTEDAVVGA